MKNQPLIKTGRDPLCAAVACVLRDIRIKLNYSIRRLAKTAKLSRPMIQMVETHQRVPTIETMARICRVFAVSVSKVFVMAERRLACLE